MPRTMRLRGGGWLKPADSLLEPKGHWEAHRDPPPDGPVPEPVEGVQALGKTVCGLRIGAGGSRALLNFNLETRISKDCLEEDMVLDNTFDFVPVPLLLGVPLMFKRLSFHEVGEEEQKEQELRYETKMYAYKLMTTPGLGLPLTWNQNGAGTRLPPILACRSDGQPFTTQDWQCLCEFHEYLDENYAPQEHLWYTNKAEFKRWVTLWMNGQCLGRENLAPCAFAEIAPCFNKRFPIGMKVKAMGLEAKPELNGRPGKVVKYDEAKLRVGVEFAKPFGLLSLKATNLFPLDDCGSERAAMLMKAIEEEQAKKFPPHMKLYPEKKNKA